MSREYAEERARLLSIEHPNEYSVAAFHSTVFQWLVTGVSGANAMIQGGFTTPSRCHGYLRGGCADWTKPIDEAYVCNNKLYAMSWILDQADEMGYEITEEVDNAGVTQRIIAETPSGDTWQVFERPTALNYLPEETR